MGIRIGIDLGTSNSSVAYVNKETSKAEMIKNHYEKTVTPSVLAFLKDGTILYGEDAKELQAQGFANTISFFKRYMGDKNYEVEFEGKVYSARQLSGIFLKKLVEEARKETGEEIEEAVITVPAYFGHKERTATIEAASLAGIKVKQIMNEPTAAALAYGIHGKTSSQTVLIYDLGGGTFDVTVAKIMRDRVTVLGIDGNHRLGGKEWDDAIARWASRQYVKRFGKDFFSDENAMIKLMGDAETVKKKLSCASSASLTIGAGSEKVTYTLTENVFEELTKPLLELTFDCIHRLLKNIGIEWEELSGIILVGGATRMKMVRRYLEEMTEVPILSGINAMEAVAIGAAIKANTDEDGNTINERLLPVPEYKILGAKRVEEAIAHSLGMVSINNQGDKYVNSILIPKNSQIPVSRTKPYLYYTKREENQLEVYLVQGEAVNPLECQIIGKYVVHDIPFLPGSKSVIDISYSYNGNGMVEVSAIQTETRRKLLVTVEEVPKDLDWISMSPQLHKSEEKIPGQRVIYVAIDLSGSMKGRPLLAAKNALYTFVHELNLSYCKVGIIVFADRVKRLLPPTDNLSVLERMIKGICLNYRELGYCNDADPFGMIYNEFDGMTQVEAAFRNAIILTDGMWAYPEQAILAARKCHAADIDVIALGFGQARTGFLRNIASSANLAKFTEMEELTIQFSKIAQEMR